MHIFTSIELQRFQLDEVCALALMGGVESAAVEEVADVAIIGSVAQKLEILGADGFCQLQVPENVVPMEIQLHWEIAESHAFWHRWTLYS